jgi:Uma2 family endonuclease
MRDNLPDELVRYGAYLRIEEASCDVRHELVGGMLHAMDGSSKRHNRIIGNLIQAISDTARDEGCDVFAIQVKLRVNDSTVYYPDVMVVCDPEDDDPLVVSRPCLIIEILSPSTAATDRREKMVAYRQIPTLLTYLVVYQDEQRVERHWRDTHDSAWHGAFLTEGSFLLPCPDMDLSLSAIYAGID